jgi:hypothetical protein
MVGNNAGNNLANANMAGNNAGNNIANANIVGNMPAGFDETDDLNSLNSDNNNGANGLNVNANMNNLNNMNNNGQDIDNFNRNQPASQTLTENIMNTVNHNDPVGLTTGQHLYDASENKVPGGDLLKQIKTVENQFGAQGMDYPMGSGARRYDGYHFAGDERADSYPNIKRLQNFMEKNERNN